MGNEAQIGNGARKSPWRIVGWSLAALILLVPLVAMQLTKEVNWTVGDFLFAALMIGLVGVAFELTVRASSNYSFRGGVAAALAASFLIVWANGAVGMIGNEDNPYNLFFFGVIAIALGGATVANFQPRGLAVAMLAAAVAQAVIGLGGINADVRGAILSTLFALLWLFSAALFRNAANAES